MSKPALLAIGRAQAAVIVNSCRVCAVRAARYGLASDPVRGTIDHVACGRCKRAHTRRKSAPAYEIHDIENTHSKKKDFSFHAIYARIKERKPAACAADSLHLLAEQAI